MQFCAIACIEIMGVSKFPDSPCVPYQGKVLSLEGRTKGFTTIDEARANGLFHPNCIHGMAVTDKVTEIYAKKDGGMQVLRDRIIKEVRNEEVQRPKNKCYRQ